jgi:hypothetical protein
MAGRITRAALGFTLPSRTCRLPAWITIAKQPTGTASMAALTNQRHERFCQAIAQGHSIAESYALAGYQKNTGNASRLNANESIQARVNELKAETAASARITIESICRELDQAIAVAKNAKQATAMVSAAALKSKLAGLMVERVEVGQPHEFDNCDSTASIVDRILEKLIERFLPIDEHDRTGLIALYEKQMKETAAYLSVIEARKICAERVNLRDLSKPWNEYPQYNASAALRIGYRNSNGSKPT